MTSADYEDLGEIGQGGQAVVHKMADLVGGGHVAWKGLLLPTDPGLHTGARVRFAREKQVLERLANEGGHTHVIEWKGDLSIGGIPGFLLALAEGGTLGDLVEKYSTGVPEALVRSLIEQLLLGLDWIHGRGVYHRDLKPSNLFLGKGDDGPLWLADFGIAYDTTLARVTGIEVPPMVSEFYAAPEQAHALPNCRLDLYTTAVIAWELLHGRRPDQDGRKAHDLQVRRKDVHPGWQRFVDVTGAVLPEDRPASARDAIALLPPQNVTAATAPRRGHAGANPVEDSTPRRRGGFALPLVAAVTAFSLSLAWIGSQRLTSHDALLDADEVLAPYTWQVDKTAAESVMVAGRARAFWPVHLHDRAGQPLGWYHLCSLDGDGRPGKCFAQRIRTGSRQSAPAGEPARRGY